MNASVAVTFVLIVLARITDITLDTVRTAAIIQGRRAFAAVLGFFEALIYVSAVAKVLLNMDHPIYTLAYALGFAIGTYLGITIEQRLAFGRQVVSLFTRQGTRLARALVEGDYRVAEVHGRVSDGEVTILYVEIARKRARTLMHEAKAIDENCFCVINDVRMAGLISGAAPSGMRKSVRRSRVRVDE
jgi:uncharacterized protein YebE (UPF0316 family)